MLSDGQPALWTESGRPDSWHDCYVQWPKSSTGASLFEEDREERDKILMFSQRYLTQILEGIQADLRLYLCFLHLGCLPDTASHW